MKTKMEVTAYEDHGLDLSHVNSNVLSNGGQSFDIISSTGTSVQNAATFSHMNPAWGGLATDGDHDMMDITMEQALEKIHELFRDNKDLRDYLKDNNEMMKKQYESLSAWKEKVNTANVENREKFTQTKAVITGLRNDNEELLKKVAMLETSREQKMSELLCKIQNLEEARIQSDKRAAQVCKQAEEQGMSVNDFDLNLSETVVVHVSAEAETRISELETLLEEKNDEVTKLTETNCKVAAQLKDFRSSTDQLLKDLESQQQIKGDLEKDNQELHEQIVDLNHQLLTDTRLSLNLIDRTQLTTKSNHSSEGNPVLKNEVEQHELSRLVEKYKTEVNELQKNIIQEKLKVERLQNQLLESSWKLETTVQQHEQEISVICRENEQQVWEITQQKDAVHEQQPQSASYDNSILSLKAQVLTLITEVQDVQKKLKSAMHTVEKRDRRLQEVEEKNRKLQMDGNQDRHASQAILQTFQHRMNYAEQTLVREKSSHEGTKHSFSELRTAFGQLVTDYKELLDTFDTYKLQQDSLTRQEANQSDQSEKFNHMTAQVIAAEEAISGRDERIRLVEEELKNQKAEFDDMRVVFQAQADVYKADFNAERHAREEQVSDKNRILQEMNDLQVQNNRLVDDLNAYSRRQMSEMQRRVAPTHGYLHVASPGIPYDHHTNQYNYPAVSLAEGGGSHDEMANLNQFPNLAPHPMDPEQHDEDDVPLVCPRCNLACPDMDTLQIHVFECLDKDEHRAADS